MWDERYSGETYAYGTEPNGFLVDMAAHLPSGRILCVGEGEGRNAVWLAQRGYHVTAVDASAVGLAKAQRLAASRGVTITTECADLAVFGIEPGTWDGIVSIFCHLPPDLRADLHRRCVAGLRPGGVMVLEAYTPRQLAHATGGPPTAALMMDSATLRVELAGLELVHLMEDERDIREGAFHNGVGAVVQVMGRKP
jgi:2-polyprenyl-3-methyl-5-hydroxy-6-metoxy-1,4-benzoquinol methylase